LTARVKHIFQVMPSEALSSESDVSSGRDIGATGVTDGARV
jgi:hypothetical protein